MASAPTIRGDRSALCAPGCDAVPGLTCTLTLNRSMATMRVPLRLTARWGWLRSVHFDAHLPQAHALPGWAFLCKHQHDAAIAGFERAFALNPNFVDNRVAPVLDVHRRARKSYRDPSRKHAPCPFQPVIISFGFLGLADYLLRRYDDAARLLGECTSRCPNQHLCWRALMPGWDNATRPEWRPRRCHRSTPTSRSGDGSRRLE